MKTADKKAKQLGMNPSTASHRLVKDILWKFIESSGEDICFKCGEKMCRENFSIEHKEPWLDSDNPQGLYFDLNNISYSHLSCNVKDSRGNRKYNSKEESNFHKREWEREVRVYSSEKRKEQYKRTGK